jgi:hypothetical protein
MIEPMILPRAGFGRRRHRCHNSGGSHIAMQGIQKPGFGYQVPPAQKESTLGVSRKMMQGMRGQRTSRDSKIKAAGIMGDADGFSLESGRALAGRAGILDDRAE